MTRQVNNKPQFRMKSLYEIKVYYKNRNESSRDLLKSSTAKKPVNTTQALERAYKFSGLAEYWGCFADWNKHFKELKQTDSTTLENYWYEVEVSKI